MRMLEMLSAPYWTSPREHLPVPRRTRRPHRQHPAPPPRCVAGGATGEVGVMLRVLDLFSGIGGFSLGLERTGGFKTVAFCEIEPFCKRVLRKHWRKVPIYDDIRTLTATRLAADGIGVDVICGGFPCQDISVAGAGAGITGERSGLWSEYARLVGELRPQYVIVENVSALLHRGLGDVLGDLAAIGYDAEWHCIPASAVGAPHRRDRIWIIAYPDGRPCDHRSAINKDGRAVPQERPQRVVRGSRGGDDVADADRTRLAQRLKYKIGRRTIWDERCSASKGRWWAVEPDVGRVAHGVPARVDRLRALGNAVVPQIPELIGRAILQAESASKILDNTRANSCVNCVS